MTQPEARRIPSRMRTTRRTPKQMSHRPGERSEEHTSELQSHVNLVCRLLLEKKNGYDRDDRQLPAGDGGHRPLARMAVARGAGLGLADARVARAAHASGAARRAQPCNTQRRGVTAGRN